MNVHRVENGANKINFSKAAVDGMKSLGLITFKGTTSHTPGITVYHYVPAVRAKGKW